MKAVFWDMDGTMVDSEGLWEIATYELSEQLGKRLTPELRALTVGGHFRHTLEIIANHAGYAIQPGDEERFKTAMFARVKGLFEQQLRPVPGVVELLTELSARDIPMVVTTNTERSLAETEIDIVGREFFVATITGDEVARPKPAPDMYLRAAQIVGADPHECLVFEDSTAGMTGAAAAGCVVFGLPADPATPLPAGVTSYRSLHPTGGFTGVHADMVLEWFRSVS